MKERFSAQLGAENVKIILKSNKEYLYFNIEDNGTGFSDSAKNDGGINIMSHHTEWAGAELSPASGV